MVLSFFAAFGLLAACGCPVYEDGVEQTRCGGVPVMRFGHTWIYAGAPQLIPDATFQVGNDHPRERIRPRGSRELTDNYIGVCTTRMPCLQAGHEMPTEAIHLIDGNDRTCWMSDCQTRGDNQPISIRVDLPVETEICRIVLRKRPLREDERRRPTDKGPAAGAVEVGRGLPVQMTVSVSCDAYHWTDVHAGPTGDDAKREVFAVDFKPMRAKQVMIRADRLCMVEAFMYACSFAELEIVEPSGENAALASRGSTVCVTSTRHNEMPSMCAQKDLWPIHWDGGFKWVRVGYHDDPINWHRVERRKGELRIDPIADAAVTALHDNGLKVVMCLNFGNRIYSGPERRQFTQLPEWHWCMPNPPTTPEALAAWDRYVEFVCRHFADRVHTFEIWNEWNIPHYWGTVPDVGAFIEIARRSVPIIRKTAPKAQVMLGSTSGFPHGISSWTAEELAKREKEDPRFVAWKACASLCDAVGYHPFYNPKPGEFANYSADIRALRGWFARQGFTGTIHASEWNVNARYPAVDPADDGSVWCGAYSPTEIQKAKEVVQHMVRHAGFGIPSCFCELYNAFYAQTELSLFKGAILQEPVSPIQPTAAYYAVRNLSTITDGFRPAAFAVDVRSGAGHIEAFSFADGTRRAVAIWYEDSERADGYRAVPAELKIPFAVSGALYAYDPINGVRQRLVCDMGGETTVVRGLRIGDAPLFVIEELVK